MFLHLSLKAVEQNGFTEVVDESTGKTEIIKAVLYIFRDASIFPSACLREPRLLGKERHLGSIFTSWLKP